MIKVGVIGLGMMGGTHLDVYSKLPGVQVVAVSDLNPDRLSGKSRAAGNVEGQAKGAFDLNSPSVKKYAEGMDLIKDKNVDLVDICLWTPLHLPYAVAALKKGKHVLSEKPMARTVAEAKKLAAAAEKGPGKFMVAQCMRFWPGWTWLKEAVDNKTYGKVLAAQFRRVANHPGGSFYENGAMCGGAALDLHIHDTDFIQYTFGLPLSVSSTGYSKLTGEIDHLVTRYEYADVPLVVAEGGWVMQAGHGFKMEYTVNFERATAVFNLANKDPLTLCENGQARPVPLAPQMGYELEIAYFVDCINRGVNPTTVTPRSALDSVRIVEAEVKSAKTGKPVKLK